MSIGLRCSVVGTDGQERSAGQAYNEASSKYQDTKNQAYGAKENAKGEAQAQTGGSQGLKEMAKSHAEDIRRSDHPLDTARAKKEEGKAEARNQYEQQTPDDVRRDAENTDRGDVKNKALNAIPDKHREKASRGIEEAKDVLDESLPQERRDQFIYRLKKVVVECQEHKDYQEAMAFFLDKFSTYKGHAKAVANEGVDSAAKVADDPAYNNASLQFRTLLERFANGQSAQPVMDSVDQMYRDADNDRELQAWYRHANEYLHKVLLEPGYILDDDSTREGEKLRDDGRRFFEDKYKDHFNTLGDEIQRFFLAMGDDPLNQRFGEDWKRLTKVSECDSQMMKRVETDSPRIAGLALRL